jgi:hypothetical protein
MAEITYNTKVFGPVTLRSGHKDGRVTMDVWFENKVIAAFSIEFLWDFIEDIFRQNPPRTVCGQMKNYIDFGSRYYCMMAASQLRNVLSTDNPKLLEVLEKIEHISLEKVITNP